MNIQDKSRGWFSQQQGSDFLKNTPKSQAVIQYEKCKKNPSSGMSGFHSPSNPVPNPFSFCGYVLVIPQVGEFNVELGEIIDGERIPLRYDSFCMK